MNLAFRPFEQVCACPVEAPRVLGASFGLSAGVVVGSDETATAAAENSAAARQNPSRESEQRLESVRAEVEFYGKPLVVRLRGDPTNWPTKEDFLKIPREFECARSLQKKDALQAALSDTKENQQCKDFPFHACYEIVYSIVFSSHVIWGVECANTCAHAIHIE